MANFLETQQVPFSQLAAFPVELYGRVGVMKQAMYDANTQKVQAFHDSIAGLDIIKEPQKAYLDSQLTKLRTDLSSLAEADFSKQSVVNQAAALAGPLSKDPTIQSAVLSTAAFRKGMSDVEKAKKDGTWSPSNTWDFQAEGNKWLTDGQVDSSFNYQYTPFRDVHKKLAESFKLLNPDITEQDIAFGPDGKLNDAMIREKIKGISPQKIQQIIQASLDPGDFKQIDIDSRYKFQNYTPDQLKQTILSHSQGSLDQWQEIQDNIKNKMSTASGSVYSSLKEKYDAAGAQINSITGNVEKYYQQIDGGDLEGAKSQFGTESFVANYANALAFREFYNTYETNPGMQTQLEKIKINQAERRLNQDQLQFEANYRLKLRELEAKDKELSPFGDLTTNVDGSLKVNEGTVVQGIQAEEKALDMTKKAISDRYSNGDPNWYRTQKELYDKGAYTNLSADVIEHFQIAEIQERDLKNHKDTYARILAEAEATNPAPNLSDVPALQINAGGQQLVLSPKEVYDFRRKFGADADFIKDPYKIASIASRLKQDPRGLTEQGRQSRQEAQQIINSLTDKERRVFEQITSREDPYKSNAAYSALQDIYSNVNKKMGKVLDARAEQINTRIAETTGVGATHEVYIGKTPEQRNQLKAIITGYASTLKASGQGFGTEGLGDGVTPDDILAMVGQEGATYQLVTAPGGTIIPDRYAVRVSTAEKGKTTSHLVPITAIQKKEMFPSVGQNEASSFVEGVQSRIIGSGNGTTNNAGFSNVHEAIKNPYLTKSHFPNVQKFSIKGDIYTSTSGAVNAKLYIYDPIKAKDWVPAEISPTVTDYGQLKWLISTLDDNKVYQLLYREKPTEEQLKKVQAVSTVQ